MERGVGETGEGRGGAGIGSSAVRVSRGIAECPMTSAAVDTISLSTGESPAATWQSIATEGLTPAATDPQRFPEWTRESPAATWRLPQRPMSASPSPSAPSGSVSSGRGSSSGRRRRALKRLSPEARCVAAHHTHHTTRNARQTLCVACAQLDQMLHLTPCGPPDPSRMDPLVFPSDGARGRRDRAGAWQGWRWDGYLTVPPLECWRGTPSPYRRIRRMTGSWWWSGCCNTALSAPSAPSAPPSSAPPTTRAARPPRGSRGRLEGV
eukprot:8239772-Pyramimonas_sp.AAC.1